MKSTYWLRLGMAVMALLAVGLIAAACGGGDDDDDDDGSGAGTTATAADSTATEDADETATEEDDDDDGGSGANPSGADERYVAQICGASLDFFNAIREVPAEDLLDESKSFEIMEEPFTEYVNAIEDADPPGDLEDYHDEAVEQLRDTLQAIKDRDQNAFDQLSEAELPDAPESVQARLDAAAADNPDCQAIGFGSDE